ncbi:PKD domain-containing protein [Vibrio vulnificus]|nr:PKD domain-containing protein [Vibrio vulnificus]
MYKISSLALAILLIGCGGDSGGGSDSRGSLRVYTPQPIVSVNGDAMLTTTAYINFDSHGVTAQTIYVDVLSNSPIVENAQIQFSSDTGGFVEVTLAPGYKAGNGISKHQVEMLACYDFYCQQHVPGSPIKATINYNVELNERASLLENETIHYQKAVNALVNDNLHQRRISLTGNHADKLKISRSPDEARLNQLSMIPQEGNEHLALIDLKLPNNLTIGDHNGDLAINICYDAQCDYPVAGSPLKIPMALTIEEPTQVPASKLAINERVKFAHNVLEAAYLPGLNLLVMTSDSPKNSLYIQDLATGEQQNFPLYSAPSSLSVDTLAKQGRVVVALEDQAEVFDFSAMSLSTPARKTVQLNSSRPSIVVRRDDLFVASNYLEKMDIASHTREISTGVSWSSPDIKLSSNGDVLLSLETNFSPQSFSAVMIEGGKWHLRNTDDQYHGDYSHSGKFWFDKTGEHYIDGDGNYYTLSDGKSLTLQWAGLVPLSSRDLTYKSSITAFIDTGSQYIIAEGEQSRVLRVIDKKSNLVKEIFAATNRADAWGSPEEHIQFAFVTDGGELYLIKALNGYQTGWQYKNPELVRVK